MILFYYLALPPGPPHFTLKLWNAPVKTHCLKCSYLGLENHSTQISVGDHVSLSITTHTPGETNTSTLAARQNTMAAAAP